MKEAKTRWVARLDEQKLGLAWHLPRNEGDIRDLCTQALTDEGYPVLLATLYYKNHEIYPGYNVVECDLADGRVITMLETEVETA